MKQSRGHRSSVSRRIGLVLLSIVLTVVVIVMFTPAQPVQAAVGLTGTVNNPDGTPFNGQFEIKMVRSGVNNTCTTPNKVVPTVPSIIKVVNGVVQGTGASFAPTNCLSPVEPYYAQLYDSKHNQVYADNWYLPTLNGVTNIDVGTLAPAMMAAPLTVSIPKAVVQTPTTDQTIVQPGSTVLSVNNFASTSSTALNGSVTVNANPLTLSSTNSASGVVIVGNDGGTPARNRLTLDNEMAGADVSSQLLYSKNGTLKWAVGNDINGSGNQDFYIFDNIAGQTRLSISSTGLTTVNNGLTVNAGVTNDGSGFKHKRTTACTTAAAVNSLCSTTITWTTPFADANYTPTCLLSNPTVGGAALTHINGVPTANGFGIEMTNGPGGGATSGTINCLAVHD